MNDELLQISNRLRIHEAEKKVASAKKNFEHFDRLEVAGIRSAMQKGDVAAYRLAHKELIEAVDRRATAHRR